MPTLAQGETPTQPVAPELPAQTSLGLVVIQCSWAQYPCARTENTFPEGGQDRWACGVGTWTLLEGPELDKPGVLLLTELCPQTRAEALTPARLCGGDGALVGN